MNKRALSLFLALTMILALAIPTLAEDESKDPVYDKYILVENAGFHCSAKGGMPNIKVAGYENGWHEIEFYGIEANGNTIWKLVSPTYACKDERENHAGRGCGSDVWFSFSNNSGVPDGKNIQFYHGEPDEPPVEELGNVSIMIGGKLTTKFIEKKYEREVYPWETWKDVYDTPYKSVTATTNQQLAMIKYNAKNGNIENKDKDFNKVVVPNANHFTYAKLAADELEDGVELTLVVGNKLNVVGIGTAKAVDGKLSLSFGSSEKDRLKFGAVTYTNVPAPKNGNVHSLAEFKHDNKAVINLAAPDKDGFIYLYVHFDNYELFLKEVMTASGTCYGEYTLVSEDLTNETIENIVTVTLFDADENEIGLYYEETEFAWRAAKDLKTGAYTIKYAVLGHECEEETECECDGSGVFTEYIDVFEGEISTANGFFAEDAANNVYSYKYGDKAPNPLGNKCVCGTCQ